MILDLLSIHLLYFFLEGDILLFCAPDHYEIIVIIESG